MRIGGSEVLSKVRQRRLLFRIPTRQGFLALLTLMGHLFVVLGCPVAVPIVKESSVGYPCQNRPCGCFSAEACWAGDCCCFTLEQKVAWADAHAIQVPAHVRPLVASKGGGSASCCNENTDSSSCCTEKTSPPASPSSTWVIGIWAAKCGGFNPGTTLDAEPCVLPVWPTLTQPMPLVGSVPANETILTVQPLLLDTPPPRP